MYPISNAAKALFDSGAQRQVLRITGNGLTITDADVVLNSFSIDRYACNGTKLEVGTAVASEMSLKLNNADGRYDDVVFEGAELYVEIGIADWTQDNPNITYIPCGYFTPDEQPRTRDIITLHALDRMMNFDAIPPQLTPWTDNNGNVMTDNYGNVIYFCADLSLPATVSGLIQQACDICQVPFTQDLSTLPNYNLTISVLPALQQDITFRNIIQWCAGIMGTNAWIDWEGKLRFSWYGTSSVYTTTMANRFSSDLSEDDITITGVGFTTGENAVVLSGDPGYIIDMSDNPLLGLVITQALPGIGNVINGFTYRPFTASVFNAPYLWPMDAVMFTDKNGDSYTCALTNVNFGINGATTLQSIGESLKTNSGARPSGLTAAQLRVINQLNASLDQEGIFNRLTNNGEVQGLILYDGKVYLNASYINTGFLSANRIKGGTIDGNTVNAKQFRVIDGDNNVVATFDSVITLGKTADIHTEIDYNSFEIKDKNGDTFAIFGDARNSDGYYEFTETFTVSYVSFDPSFPLEYIVTSVTEILSLYINDTLIDSSNYYISQSSDIFPTSVLHVKKEICAINDSVVVTYRSVSPVYRYDFGYRNPSQTVGIGSFVEGYDVTAKGRYSHAEGLRCNANGVASHAEGRFTSASNSAHAEGIYTNASGTASHAEGGYTTATGYAHAEGNTTTANGPYSHTEGYYSKTTSDGSYAHAEGWSTTASSLASHAEGKQTTASGSYSHAEGEATTASGHCSHAEGLGTIANKESQHVVGRWNVADPAGSGSLTYIEIVGNGTENSRLNIRTLDYHGNEWINGTLTQASDNRLKTEDGEVPDLSGIKARAFHWNANKQRHDDKLHLGYFAQDVEAIAPYLVDEDAMGYKSLDYNAVFVAKITALEKRVAELERRINTCR